MKNNKGQKKEPIISNKQRRSYLKRFSFKYLLPIYRTEYICIDI